MFPVFSLFLPNLCPLPEVCPPPNKQYACAKTLLPLPKPTTLPVYRAHPSSCVLLLLGSSFLLLDHCQPTLFITLISEPQTGLFSTNPMPCRYTTRSSRPASPLLSGHCELCLLSCSGLAMLSTPARGLVSDICHLGRCPTSPP